MLPKYCVGTEDKPCGVLLGEDGRGVTNSSKRCLICATKRTKSVAHKWKREHGGGHANYVKYAIKERERSRNRQRRLRSLDRNLVNDKQQLWHYKKRGIPAVIAEMLLVRLHVKRKLRSLSETQ